MRLDFGSSRRHLLLSDVRHLLTDDGLQVVHVLRHLLALFLKEMLLVRYLLIDVVHWFVFVLEDGLLELGPLVIVHDELLRLSEELDPAGLLLDWVILLKDGLSENLLPFWLIPLRYVQVVGLLLDLLDLLLLVLLVDDDGRRHLVFDPFSGHLRVHKGPAS